MWARGLSYDEAVGIADVVWGDGRGQSEQ